MFNILLLLHVAAAILLLGPVAVAVSAFGGSALKASQGDTTHAGIARFTHRITQTYGMASILVPLLGATLLFSNWSSFKSQPQFHIAIVLALVAWVLLFVVIVPKQKKLVSRLGLLSPADSDPSDANIDPVKTKKQLAMFGGIFNLLWVIVFILMYV
ncbi:DUF2269 domain-containing protein [Corynebacterium tapiri]|uniref:DUF2269 domain-containing protein n=1 Tax=Corynebacterium tapiri TaxID=1448266 RepID=A0A5C4U701_9CORY|nr:DUF2269 domain-containing protein [Corynebacterium tapiri]TNL99694.1 DUF2269 domain-containing protein [Corynebacterium tapiri]